MKTIAPFILILILISCTAQWHFRRAIKKDPSLFTAKPDTTIATYQKPMPGVSIPLPSPTTHVYKFDTVIVLNEKDTLIYRLHYTDSIFTAEIDCPDCADSVMVIREPYPEPVYLKPTWKEKLMAGAGILVVIIAIIGIIKIAISIFRLV